MPSRTLASALPKDAAAFDGASPEKASPHGLPESASPPPTAAAAQAIADLTTAPPPAKRPSRRRRPRSGTSKRERTPQEPIAAADSTTAPEATPALAAPPIAQRRTRRRGEFSDNVFAAVDRSEPRAASVRDDGAPADIAPHLLDQDGLRILDRLHKRGFEAYFVGGCVRDLLIGQKPKDFDISTSARPEEIRALFGNCRLIGRRFRLAHVFFRDGKIIEVSTFRAKPPHADAEDSASLDGEDLLIVQDNVFGTSAEDAQRRDLTINGLFYDVQRGRVIDFVGSGLDDLNGQLIRSIGDPEIRLREDPVRILRAIRFAARFGFDIERTTWEAMKAAVAELPRCSAPRLLEEMFKFLRSGVAHASFATLHELGVLGCLLRPIDRWLSQAAPEPRARFYAELKALDGCVREAPLDDATLLAAILTPLVEASEDGELSQAVEEPLDRGL